MTNLKQRESFVEMWEVTVSIDQLEEYGNDLPKREYYYQKVGYTHDGVPFGILLKEGENIPLEKNR